MKKIIITSIILISVLSIQAADDRLPAAAGRPIYQEPRENITYILNALHEKKRITSDLAFQDFLEEITDQMEPKDTTNIIKLILELSEKDKHLNVDILKQAITLYRFNPKKDPTKVHQTIKSELPGNHPMWECSKEFVIGGSIATCTTFALVKAAQYCLENKSENVSFAANTFAFAKKCIESFYKHFS